MINLSVLLLFVNHCRKKKTCLATSMRSLLKCPDTVSLWNAMHRHLKFFFGFFFCCLWNLFVSFIYSMVCRRVDKWTSRHDWQLNYWCFLSRYDCDAIQCDAMASFTCTHVNICLSINPLCLPVRAALRPSIRLSVP